MDNNYCVHGHTGPRGMEPGQAEAQQRRLDLPFQAQGTNTALSHTDRGITEHFNVSHKSRFHIYMPIAYFVVSNYLPYYYFLIKKLLNDYNNVTLSYLTRNKKLSLDLPILKSVFYRILILQQ